MSDGDKLDQRAREIAKMIDEHPIDDLDGLRILLAKAEEVRLDFNKWVEENNKWQRDHDRSKY